MTLSEFFEQVKEIGVLQQGFSCELFSHIDPYIIIEAFKEVAAKQMIDYKTDHVTVELMVLDEALSIMELDEFEEIASYFIGSSNIEK